MPHGNGKNTEADEGGRSPVRLASLFKREEQVHDQQRQGEHNKKTGSGMRRHLGPGRPERDDQSDKNDRRIHAKMRADEFEQLRWMGGKRAIETSAGAKVGGGDPLVAIVPDDDWNSANAKCAQKQVDAGAPEFAPVFAGSGKEQRDGEKL